MSESRQGEGRYSWYCPAHHLHKMYVKEATSKVQAQAHASRHGHRVVLSSLTWVEPEPRLHG